MQATDLMLDDELEAQLAALEADHQTLEEKVVITTATQEDLENGIKQEESQAKSSIDYRVYYDGIDEEFKKSEDCQFTFQEITLQSPELADIIAKNKVFLDHLREQCQQQGPMMLCSNQSTNEWRDLRKERVTSSLFGRVAKRRKFDPASSMVKFVQNHLNPYRYLGDIESLAYGKLLENDGIKKYQATYPHIQVKETGVWSNSNFPWMGGSPDGLIYDRNLEEEGLLEIKCPVRGKNSNFAAIASQKGFYMVKGDDGKYRLNPKDEYYYQIQGCLNILNRNFCDFVVITNEDIYVERIKKDEAFFATMKEKLKEFYFRFYLPYNSSKPKLEKNIWQYTFLSKEVFDSYYSKDDN